MRVDKEGCAMRRNCLAAAAAGALLLLLNGCGSGGSPASALQGPAETVALYKSQCLSCHGADLKGRMGPATDIHDAGSRLAKERITAQIENGGELMPPFKDKLTPAQIEDLTRWLLEQK
jgi:cytochrome c551